ncbi:hypothetical protein Raf01_76060 [Rugosimonospora africana]|uniref:Uncharacterized protein n=2 Tax=Rugosimonospora africana TaxID=556532 RepID=A0A8J3VV09_9ACTN|nr:hypothetical protein Raf01_76060 [Rugosimonospora africana]
MIRGLGRFLFDFVVGDEWRIAVGVVAALLIGWVWLAAGAPVAAGVVVTALLMGSGFTVTMLREGRGRRK